MTISDAIRYVGVNDTDIDLFESQYPVPHGVSYNSYLLLDDKIALLDTVDKRKYDDWAAPLRAGPRRQSANDHREISRSHPGAQRQGAGYAASVF